jgi:aryl-alcohol dehydrogenase-like predicted oxidoreductase
VKIEKRRFFHSARKIALQAGRYPFSPQDGILVRRVIRHNYRKVPNRSDVLSTGGESLQQCIRANNPKEIAVNSLQYLELGASGLRVSRLGLGTAAFGYERYGVAAPDEGIVDAALVIRTIQAAVDGGITFFDTAPGYGRSEDLLGQALALHKDCIIATKVSIPEEIDTIAPSELSRLVEASLDASRRALRRDVLDIVQIHNATIPVLQQGRLVEQLERARNAGKLRWIGASVYGPDTALAVLRTEKIQVLQTALSLLDQRMCSHVFPEAEKAGISILTRSALLKGALTMRARWLPESLRPVAEASERAVHRLGTTWNELPNLALRFCLALPAAHTVLVGVREPAELLECLAAEAEGPLPLDLLKIAGTLTLDDEHLLNPTYWRLEEGDTGEAQR